MATLTLRNVPDDLYAELKKAAKRNRRSLNQEAIARLAPNENEPHRGTDLAWERASALREKLGMWVDHDEIKELINAGRTIY